MRYSGRSRHKPPLGPVLLGTSSAAAAIAFAMLNRATVRRKTRSTDEAVYKRVTPPRRHPVRDVARAVHPVGKWYLYVPAAFTLATALLDQKGGTLRPLSRRKKGARRRGALAIAASGIAAAAADKLFEHVLPQPPAPPGHPTNKPVFPSGHTLGPAVVGLVSSYVLGRTGVASPARTVPAALAVPLVGAASRLVEERHWGSDVLGGILGGAAVAGVVLTLFELTSDL